MASTSQMEVDPENRLKERDAEIVKIFKIFDIIVNRLGQEKSAALLSDIKRGAIDIDVSDEISGVLMTAFTCLRKEINDPSEHKKYKAFTAKVANIEISISSIIEEIKVQKIELNFLVATPIIELLTLFKSSFDEVRTGVTRFRVRESVAKKTAKRDSSGKIITQKDKTKEMTHNITQYGINNHHVRLLQGITFAPERRTGVIRSLGPLAQAIMLVLEDKYYNNLQSAMSNSLQMLPMANEVITCLKEARSPGSVAGILKVLGDLLIMTTARSTQKFYFPLSLYYYLWGHKSDSALWRFSGANMIKYYTEAVSNGFIIFRTKSGGDKVKTAQVVFNAMFGTYLDDLDVCEQITLNTGRWFQRKDVNSVFIKRGEAPKIEFTPIRFKYVSKMAQALQTKSLGNVDPVSTCRPSFSGARKRSFTAEFASYLRTGKASLSYSSDPVQLQYSLKKTKDQVMEDLDNVKLMQAGTTEWEEYKSGVWITSGFVAAEGNRKFFGF